MKRDRRLRRVLGPIQLTSLGVGAIIGSGIFVLTGKAAHDTTGPALMLSFVASGIACIFAALCYAEFASMTPVAGSAYTYAYATMGELFAWIIGWDLVLEYAVGSATVAHGWSHYFQDFIKIFGLHLPHALTTAPFDYDPGLGRLISTHTVLDLPAILIAGVIAAILVKGIKESASFNAGMVIVKLCIVFFVIIVGAFYVDPANWKPFAPYGFTGISFFGKTLFGTTDAGGQPLGMLAGAAIIFFAYIGFDSVSTHAEEARRPNRDVPIGIVASLIICTFLYIAVAAVLTGMVPYNQINIDAPVSDAFAQKGLNGARFLISLGALTGITSVLLVMMLSLPRVMLAMARDGLVPPSFFGAVHPKFRTPWKTTILTGAFVAALAAFLPLRILAELVNIGTLLAFVMVCAAVLIMRKIEPNAPRPFRAPFVPAVPILGMATCLLLMLSLPATNWWLLGGWLLLGLPIYFGYGRHHSVMVRYLAQTSTGHGVSMADFRLSDAVTGWQVAVPVLDSEGETTERLPAREYEEVLGIRTDQEVREMAEMDPWARTSMKVGIEDAAESEKSHRYRVWFGTNRALRHASDPLQGFDNRRDPEGLVHCGRCNVAIPKTHRFGEVGRPWWQRWESFFRDDHLQVIGITLYKDPTSFFSTLRAEMQSLDDAERHLLTYIHGYNLSFEQAAVRAAQLGFDLRVPGETAFFSWPSRASLDDYPADEAAIEGSEAAIADFLRRIAHESGATSVHVIAHSMGSRGFGRAIQRITAAAAKDTGIRFAQIILAAPDVDVELFRDLARSFPLVCQRTTMYVSRKDRALQLSRWFHGFDRAGYTPPITIVEDVDTVEVSNIDLTVLGHGYYAKAQAVLYDMGELIRHGEPPQRRARLRRVRTDGGLPYWVITA